MIEAGHSTDDWPVERFTPTRGQAASSVGLVLAGLAGTILIGRLGGVTQD